MAFDGGAVVNRLIKGLLLRGLPRGGLQARAGTG
jgi:hypothetical protein